MILDSDIYDSEEVDEGPYQNPTFSRLAVQLQVALSAIWFPVTDNSDAFCSCAAVIK